MKVRSITGFADVHYPLETDVIARLGEAIRAVRTTLEGAGIEVETTRVATQPFPAVLEESGPASAVDLARDMEAVAFVHEISYLSLGPVRLDDPAAFIEVIPEILQHTESVFACVEIANEKTGIGLPRTRRAADLIRRVSSVTPDGFANLRLAALANVGPMAPFFPAAYHRGGPPAVALAIESADLAVTAVSGARTLEEARTALVKTIEMEAGRLENLAQQALEPLGIAFAGIDFSLAPFPEEARSIGTALEQLGLPAIGSRGTLFAAAFLTSALDRAEFTRTGFCGLMLPVMEDSVLARRAAEDRVTVSDLLTYSAVCGTGLDTIPLPGNVTSEALSAILLDMAVLALRLGKPLTARLMPVPGKKAGDETDFDFEYFANSRVFAASEESLSRLLAGDENLTIQRLSMRRP